MPRATKKDQLAELDGHPTKLTLEYLRGLSRVQIQGLAKRYGIRANQKTKDIIKELVVKNESQETNLVPVAFGKGRAQMAPGKRQPTAHQDTATCEDPILVADSVPVVEEVNVEAALQPQEGDDSDAGSCDSGYTNADKPRLNKRRATPYFSAEERQALKKAGGSIKNSSKGAKQPSNKGSHLTDPTVKDVRRVRRLLASLNKDRLDMQQELEATKTTLAFAHQVLASGTDNVKAISWRRELYERDVVANMKSDRTLWDGTPYMAPKDRREWNEFLDANWELSKRDNHDSSAEEIDDDDEGEGDDEMSDGDVPFVQPVVQPLSQAAEEVDYDDIYA